jgi:hypothetical protein
MAEMQCGVITMEEPYQVRFTGSHGDFILLFRGDEFAEGSCRQSTEWLQTVLDHLNGAYRRGYRDCGTILMPELMKLKGAPPKKEFVPPTPAPISTVNDQR